MNISEKLPLKICVVVMVSLLISSCAVEPSETDIQTAIAETQSSIKPTSTETLIPISEIEGELTKLGDFPEDFIGGQIKSNLPEILTDKVPTPDRVIQQRYKGETYDNFGILILLYEDEADITTAFENLISYNNASPKKEVTYLEGIGEKAISAGFGDTGMLNISLVFTRCRSLVYIDLYPFYWDADGEITTTYAKRLDDRITPLVCK